MPPIDDNAVFSHETDEPSRSQRRREALAVFDLAEQLVRLSAAQLAALPMADELRALIADTRRITAPIARKRQLQYLAKQMRRREDELPPIRAALEHDRQLARRDTAALHRIEHWRDRLVAEGDGALNALLEERPDADRHQLRQLLRRARAERDAGRPPAAARELFRELKRLFRPPQD